MTVVEDVSQESGRKMAISGRRVSSSQTGVRVLEVKPGVSTTGISNICFSMKVKRQHCIHSNF